MKKNSAKKGITLISLVITIIVLLILATVAISIAVGGNGLFERAEYAGETWNESVSKESTAVENALLIMNQLNIGGTDGNDNKEVTLNESNYKQYLGKEVTNYKTGSAETETVGSYTVSTKYRLYYVDFAGKYGDEGTIYLKADCTEGKYKPTKDTTSIANTKAKELNPELYKPGITSPDESKDNMQLVKWLTNPTNWDELKRNVNSSITDSIKYIVGAPSVEMMFDSYNLYYDLKGESPDNSYIEAGTKRKLFCKYTSNDGRI